MRTTQPTISTRRGVTVSVDKPLLAPTRRPMGGWGVVVVVNGSQLEIGGKDGYEVARKYSGILGQNNIMHTQNEVWTTLNHIWLPKTAAESLLVSLDSFLSICEPSGTDIEKFAGKIPVDTWLPVMLDSIGFYLSTDPATYTHARLVALADVICHMLSSATSHRLSDPRAHTLFLDVYSTLRQTPRHKIEDARVWFMNAHNRLAPSTGRDLLTQQSATLKYTWLNGTQS